LDIEMKFFYAIVLVNLLVVIGVIGFVVWQFFDSGNPMGLIILAVILLAFLGFFIYIGVPGMILRWYIKSTGEPARAVILERRMGNLEMYSGGSEYETGKLTSQQVVLKLEVHPNIGATYVAEDRFWATPFGISQMTPGREMQVIVARNNPKRVVSLPETMAVSARS
jgi:hypothetical protein